MVQSYIYEIIITEKEFCLRRFERFGFDRGIVEKILNDDHTAMIKSYREMIDGERFTELHQFGRHLTISGLRDDSGDLAHFRNLRQRFSSESIGLEMEQILLAVDLRGRISSQEKVHVSQCDACPIVFDTDERFTSIIDRDNDISSAGIQAILYQFFDNRGRSFYNISVLESGGHIVR